MNEKKKISIYDVVAVAIMAAVVFVVTMFLSIRIPTPTGTTMIKLANAFILMAGILLGGWRGGLASGFGSMFFDLMTPEYVPEAWITFLRFFLMAYICGAIAHAGGAVGRRNGRNLAASIVAALFSSVFYTAKNVIVLMAAGSAFGPAFVANIPKLAASLPNVVIAVAVTTVLTPVLRHALAATNFYRQIGMQP